MDHIPLTDEERAIWQWQMCVPGFGEEGQQKLKNASVLISRCGGLGSVVVGGLFLSTIFTLLLVPLLLSLLFDLTGWKPRNAAARVVEAQPTAGALAAVGVRRQ